MKKKTLIAAMIMSMLMGLTALARAEKYSDTVDFRGCGTYLGATYTELLGEKYLCPFEYTHYLDEVPSGCSITGATLKITHVGNISDCLNSEIWLACSGENRYIGRLSKSPWGAWKTDTFALDEDILDELTSTDPWSLTVKLYDPTILPDLLRLDKSVLCVKCEPVPEPSSLALLGLGLIGFVRAGMLKLRSRA